MTEPSRVIRHHEKKRMLLRQRLSFVFAAAFIALLTASVLYGDRFTACVTGAFASITLLAINPWRIRQYTPGLNSNRPAVRALAILAYLAVIIAILGAAALKYPT